jgi:hypothetical protein
LEEIKDAESHYMWCFNPRPLIAMEFKYPGIIRDGTLDKDIQTLLHMEKVYGVQRLYLCLGASDYGAIEKVLPSIYEKLAHNPSARKKFRIAVGTLVENEWEIVALHAFPWRLEVDVSLLKG